jgi:hypothetical protein
VCDAASDTEGDTGGGDVDSDAVLASERIDDVVDADMETPNELVDEATDAEVEAVERAIGIGFATGESFERVGNSLGFGAEPAPEALGSGVEGSGGCRAPSEHP